MEAGAVNSLFTDEWIYIRYRDDGFEELYDRRNDPHDLRNLAKQPRYAELCRALAGRLQARLTGSETSCPPRGRI